MVHVLLEDGGEIQLQFIRLSLSFFKFLTTSFCKVCDFIYMKGFVSQYASIGLCASAVVGLTEAGL